MLVDDGFGGGFASFSTLGGAVISWIFGLVGAVARFSICAICIYALAVGEPY